MVTGFGAFSAAAALSISLLVAGQAVGQSTDLVPPLPPLAPGQPSVATFKSAVDLVTLNVSVIDPRNQRVSGLAQNDFQVLEDGVPQPLTFFSANRVPLDVALLIDSSSSMELKLPIVREAAKRFIQTLTPADRAEIVTFTSQARIPQRFTSDIGLLEDAVSRTTARGGTALYGAIYVAIDQFIHLERKGNGEVRRPAIIVLTDGQDTASLIQYDDLLERARRAGVAIYSISVISPSDSQTIEIEGGKRYDTPSDYALKTLARETGARAFFPLSLTELNGVYASVADELASQYALGYAPAQARADGSFHRVLVRVLSRPDAKLRTRSGYYSPGPARASLK